MSGCKSIMIMFFGPDGTGKTTLAGLLEAYLRSKGYKVRRIRLRSHHLAMYVLISLLRKLKLVPNTNSPRILSYSLRRYFKNSRVFMYLEAINVILWILMNVKLRNLLSGNVVTIAERYVPDFIVDTILVTSEYSFPHALLKILGNLMKNSVKIFLYAQFGDVLNRKKDEVLSVTYLAALTRIYASILPYIGIDMCLNTSKYNKLESFLLIKNIVESMCAIYKEQVILRCR